MAEQILSLSTTEFDRPTVKIDGVAYRMRVPEELTIPKRAELLRGSFRLRQIIGMEEENAEQAVANIEEQDAIFSRQVKDILIDLPDEVLAKLTAKQKELILAGFTKLWARGLGSPTPSNESETASSSPSPDASASTAVQ